MPEGRTENAVARRRRERALSQTDLARAIGVSRQALSSLESGRSIPSTAVALRLARTLECSVEQLFWLEEGEVDVELAGERSSVGRARLAHVAGRWVAHPISALSELADADVLHIEGERGRARLLDDPRMLRERLLIAGCDPALGLLTKAAERARIPAAWITQTSTRALLGIGRAQIHVAGAHLYDVASGEHNLPFVRELLPSRPCITVELASTDEGLVVGSTNVRAIRDVRDLARPGIRFVNRPPGAAARELLDRELEHAGVDVGSVNGYDRALDGHEAVARAIAEGAADAAIATHAIALAYGLGFVPLHSARFDLVVPVELTELPAIDQLLDLVNSSGFRRQLAALGGYDTRGTGRISGRT